MQALMVMILVLNAERYTTRMTCFRFLAALPPLASRQMCIPFNTMSDALQVQRPVLRRRSQPGTPSSG